MRARVAEGRGQDGHVNERQGGREGGREEGRERGREGAERAERANGSRVVTCSV
jgi:hypothetical protein